MRSARWPPGHGGPAASGLVAVVAPMMVDIDDEPDEPTGPPVDGATCTTCAVAKFMVRRSGHRQHVGEVQVAPLIFGGIVLLAVGRELVPQIRPGEVGAVPLKPDLVMQGHGHGMTVVPNIIRRENCTFLVQGMLMHMPGLWTLILGVERGGNAERAYFHVDIWGGD